jgi:hypothetical protein
MNHEVDAIGEKLLKHQASLFRRDIWELCWIEFCSNVECFRIEPRWTA